ncbi:MAG: 50S ribosomal protein L32, partial [Phaeodactylibacter sp.]|nr:50S ribosomal protein L32 [Phaeodactylibacter sp.]
PNVATCANTGEKHLLHRAYRDLDGNMYYRGKMLIKVEEEL